MDKVCVLGAGSWGSALALVLAKNGYDVSLWTRDSEQADSINKTKENPDDLPGVLFPNNIKVTTNIEDSVSNSKLIVLAVPSQAIRSISKQIKPFVKGEQILVDVAKGLEKGTGLRLSEVCREELQPSDDVCQKFLENLWEKYDEKEYNFLRYDQMAECFSKAMT